MSLLPEPIVYVRLVNRTEFNVQVCQSNEEENNFFCEMLPGKEELTKVTRPGWTFEFVGGFGNLLYVSLESLTASRSIQFKPSAVHGKLHDSPDNPLSVFIHKSRFAVEPNVTSVDAIGRPLHSLSGEELSYVTFYNSSSVAVVAFWLNYQGIRVHYGDIQPGDSKHMDTYVTHPWLFVQKTDHNLDMLVNDVVRIGEDDGGDDSAGGKPHRLYKDSWSHFFPPKAEDPHQRHLVIIHPRMHSLKSLAMSVVRNKVAKKELKLDEEFVPASLIKEVVFSSPKGAFLSLDEMEYFNQFD